MTAIAQTTFELFLRQMSDWEKKYAALNESLEEDFDAWKCMIEEAKEIYRRILLQFCDVAMLSKEALEDCSFETPSRFDPDRDKISKLDENDAHVLFEYEQTVGLRSKFRFALSRIDGRWIITKAEVKLLRAGKPIWASLYA